MPSSVTQAKGARVAIHPSDVTPLISDAGMEISPASLTSISISEVREARPASYAHPPPPSRRIRSESESKAEFVSVHSGGMCIDALAYVLAELGMYVPKLRPDHD